MFCDGGDGDGGRGCGRDGDGDGVLWPPLVVLCFIIPLNPLDTIYVFSRE